MADGIKKTHNVLKFRDNTRELERPILKLMKRSGDFIGIIQYENLNCSFIGNAVDEMTFDVRKYIDGEINPLWDEFKQESIRIVEYNNYGRFEASVTLNDKEDTIKSISCKSLEVELGQVILHEFHVNDEDDILRSDYETTYLYDNTTPIPNARIGLIDAHTNVLLETAVSDAQGQCIWTTTESGIYKSVAYDMRTNEIILESNIIAPLVYNVDIDNGDLIINKYDNIPDSSISVIDSIINNDEGDLLISIAQYNSINDVENAIYDIDIDENGDIYYNTIGD